MEFLWTRILNRRGFLRQFCVMKSNFRYLIIIAAFFIGIFWLSIAHAGFGVSPPKIVNKYLLPGSHFEQTVYLVQNKPEIDIKISADMSGEVENWISIDKGVSFIVPAGIQQYPIKVMIDVPEDVEFKHYGGNMRITGKPAEEGGVVTIALGVLLNFDLEVSREAFTDFILRGIIVSDIEKGWPIKIMARVENLGNTEAGPNRISASILNEYKEKIRDLGETNAVGKTKPFSVGQAIGEFKNDLEVGEYWADIKIFDKDKVVWEGYKLFKVLPRGSINKWANWKRWALGALAFVAVFILWRKGIISVSKLRAWKKKRVQRRKRKLQEKLKKLGQRP